MKEEKFCYIEFKCPASFGKRFEALKQSFPELTDHERFLSVLFYGLDHMEHIAGL